MTNAERIDEGQAKDEVNDVDTLFFEFDSKTGARKDNVFNCRAILANQELWIRMQDGLFSILKSNAAVILYQIGLEYGIAVGEKGHNHSKDIEGAIKFLEIYGYLAGWGKFSTSPVVLSSGQLAKPVIVTVKNNFFALSVQKRSGPQCFIVAGMLAGIAEGLLGEGYNCVETMCAADGGKHCEFMISRRN